MPIEKVYKVSRTRVKSSAHTPRRKLALATLFYEFENQPFTREEARVALSEVGLLEDISFGKVWSELVDTKFLTSPYSREK